MGLATSTRAELRQLGVDPRKDAVADLAVFLAKQLDKLEDPKTVPGLARQHQTAMVEVRREAAARAAAAARPRPMAATKLDELRQRRGSWNASSG